MLISTCECVNYVQNESLDRQSRWHRSQRFSALQPRGHEEPAMLVNQVPTNLAVAIKAAGAQSVFNAIDALKTKLEEEEKGGETA